MNVQGLTRVTKAVKISTEQDSVQRRNENSKLLREAVKTLGEEHPQFVLVVLPSDKANIFSDLKRWADCDLGVASLRVQAKILEDKTLDRRVMGNLW